MNVVNVRLHELVRGKRERGRLFIVAGVTPPPLPLTPDTPLSLSPCGVTKLLNLVLLTRSVYSLQATYKKKYSMSS
jgi:hypothetical protein